LEAIRSVAERAWALFSVDKNTATWRMPLSSKVLDVLRAGTTDMPFASAVAAEQALKRVLRAA
jgi:hypothetical protein